MLVTPRWMGSDSSAACPTAQASGSAGAGGSTSRKIRNDTAAPSRELPVKKKEKKQTPLGDKKPPADLHASAEQGSGSAARASGVNAARGERNVAKRKKRKKPTDEAVVKAPEDVLAYLQSWEAKASGETSSWRFNSNTQAWLIRHAYDVERVPKTTFRLLLRYLEGLRGAARERTRTDAEAVVLLKGAPLDASVPEPPLEEEGDDEGAASGATGSDAKRKRNKGDACDADQDPDAEGAEQDPIEEDKADAKARKVRLRRAEQLVQVLGDSV